MVRNLASSRRTQATSRSSSSVGAAFRRDPDPACVPLLSRHRDRGGGPQSQADSCFRGLYGGYHRVDHGNAGFPLNELGQPGQVAHAEAAEDKHVGTIPDAGFRSLDDAGEHLIPPPRQLKHGTADHALRHEQITDSERPEPRVQAFRRRLARQHAEPFAELDGKMHGTRTRADDRDVDEIPQRCQSGVAETTDHNGVVAPFAPARDLPDQLHGHHGNVGDRLHGWRRVFERLDRDANVRRHDGQQEIVPPVDLGLSQRTMQGTGQLVEDPGTHRWFSDSTFRMRVGDRRASGSTPGPRRRAQPTWLQPPRQSG